MMRLTAERYRASQMDEDSLLTAVTQLLSLRRWLWCHYRRSDKALLQGDPGWPDLFAARPPRLLAIELKSARGQLQPGQKLWQAQLVKGGVECFVWRPADWLSGEIERVLGCSTPSG